MNSLEILKGNNHIDCSNTLLNLISSEINDSENYSLGLSGGSTPKFFYELFAEKYKDYSNIYLWAVDERHVDINDENSNQRMINSIFNNSNLNIIEYSYEEDPRNSAKNRVMNRCQITGRPHGVYRKLKISRIALRQLGLQGKIPGMVKSSW